MIGINEVYTNISKSPVFFHKSDNKTTYKDTNTYKKTAIINEAANTKLEQDISIFTPQLVTKDNNNFKDNNTNENKHVLSESYFNNFKKTSQVSSTSLVDKMKIDIINNITHYIDNINKDELTQISTINFEDDSFLPIKVLPAHLQNLVEYLFTEMNVQFEFDHITNTNTNTNTYEIEEKHEYLEEKHKETDTYLIPNEVDEVNKKEIITIPKVIEPLLINYIMQNYATNNQQRVKEEFITNLKSLLPLFLVFNLFTNVLPITQKKYIIEIPKYIETEYDEEEFFKQNNPIMPYNSNNYAMNCININFESESKSKRNKDTKDNNKVLIIYNYHTLTSFVWVDKDDTNNDIDANSIYTLINDYPEYYFTIICEYSLNNTAKIIHKHLVSSFNKHKFNNEEEFKLLIEYTNKHLSEMNIKEEIIVKQYLQHNYIFDGSQQNKIKASILYDDILNSHKVKNYVTINEKYFRNRLAEYLIDLGLQKKRYNDGYYYYGIIKKNLNNNILSSCYF